MGGRYLNEVSVSVYPPQDKNRKGERHEHWGMFSHDRARKTLVLELASSGKDFQLYSRTWLTRTPP